MQAPQPPEIEKLLIPISSESPAGEFLRYQGRYDAIQEARQEDDPALPRGVWQTRLKRADWRKVETLCVDALENLSKDLQIGAWLLEAMIHRYGFVGVREGLKLLAGLCERFWPTLYPPVDEEDLEGRLAPIVWINTKLYPKLKLIPVTRPQGEAEVLTYTFADKERGDMIESLPPKQRINQEDELSQAAFLKSVMQTSISFYARQAKYLTACLAHLQYLDSLLEEKCGSQAPGLGQFRETLEHINYAVTGFLREKQEAQAQTEAGSAKEAPAEEAEHFAENTAFTGTSALSIRSRDQAYRILAQVADYLMIREPHSPVPHLIKRAVAWGRMSLPELLAELVNNESDLAEIFKLLALEDRDA